MVLTTKISPQEAEVWGYQYYLTQNVSFRDAFVVAWCAITVPLCRCLSLKYISYSYGYLVRLLKWAEIYNYCGCSNINFPKPLELPPIVLHTCRSVLNYKPRTDTVGLKRMNNQGCDNIFCDFCRLYDFSYVNCPPKLPFMFLPGNKWVHLVGKGDLDLWYTVINLKYTRAEGWNFLVLDGFR